MELSVYLDSNAGRTAGRRRPAVRPTFGRGVKTRLSVCCCPRAVLSFRARLGRVSRGDIIGWLLAPGSRHRLGRPGQARVRIPGSDDGGGSTIRWWRGGGRDESPSPR